MRRSRTLRSESLNALTPDELAHVAGAAAHTTPLVACAVTVVTQALDCAIAEPSIVCLVTNELCDKS
jgi:hypothetical protein